MSSVIVKGMKMPKTCFKCDFRDGLSCIAKDERAINKFRGIRTRETFCPLVTLPEKHGRLVDADAMCNDLVTVDIQYRQMIEWCVSVTEAQPTIVEAEGE